MRDYLFFDRYLDELSGDVYYQPEDEGHDLLAKEIIEKWLPHYIDADSVLDVGCGTGFCAKYFRDMKYVGITPDNSSYEPLILTMDFTFTKFGDETFDMILSRHSLEHSPFPLLTLMEWHRIARKYMLLVLPNPKHYTFIGRNHYSVMGIQQARWLLRRAGWKITETDYSENTELRFFCEKQTRVGHEGYIEILDNSTYEADRDEE